MAAKKTTKQVPATKTAKAKGTKPAKTKPATAQPTDECPKGGSHKWTEDETDRFCSKCQEPAGAKKSRKAKTTKKPAANKTDGKLSQLDAAAKVLGEENQPMNTKEMVEAMGQKGYWTSPGGNTALPRFSAILSSVGAGCCLAFQGQQLTSVTPCHPDVIHSHSAKKWRKS